MNSRASRRAVRFALVAEHLTIVRIYTVNGRHLKDLPYEQVARVRKALAGPKRIEIRKRLAQGEKSAQAISGAVAVQCKLAGACLKALREAPLMQSRRDVTRTLRRIRSEEVAQFALRAPPRAPVVAWDGGPCGESGRVPVGRGALTKKLASGWVNDYVTALPLKMGRPCDQ